MNILIPRVTMTYNLLDAGDGKKLEQIGSNIIIRPDGNCIWKKQQPNSLWLQATTSYEKNKAKNWEWVPTKKFNDPWIFSYTLPPHQENRVKKISCALHVSSSKNIGIFPEQASNWDWMVRTIQSSARVPKILNLFGYTGAATLCAASAGAEVCHVDSSQSAVTWGRNNQILSKLEDAPIRWIVDDCSKFITREIKRGMQYDGLIMDPPAFGRDQKGNIFEFEKEICKLLTLCTHVLVPKPLFVIFNGYSMGYSATVLYNVLKDFFPKYNIEFGELHLEEKSGRTLPCSLFARFST